MTSPHPPPALRDPVHEEELTDRGFVVLPRAALPHVEDLRRLAVEALDLDHRPRPPRLVDERDLPWDHHHAPGRRWRLGLHELSDDERDRLEEQANAFWTELIGTHLLGHEHLFTSVMAKEPGEESELPLHQDPTYLDERQARSFTVWVALDEISPRAENGALHVLPGSHVAGRGLRGTHLDPAYLRDQAQLWSEAEALHVEAGDVVVMDSRVVHGSPPNRSERARFAIVAVVVPRGVALWHILGDPDGRTASVLAVDRAFYRRSSPLSLALDPPTGLPVIDRLDLQEHRTETAAIIEAARSMRGT